VATFTAPVAGYYQFEMSVTGSSVAHTLGQNINCGFKINGSTSVYMNTNYTSVSATFPASSCGSRIRLLSAGDTVVFFGNFPVTTTASAFSGSIFRLSGPATIAATETVACRYTNSAGTTLTKSAANTVPFATKDYDTHGAFVTDTFTCPIPGKYAVKSTIHIATGATWASGDNVEMDILKNGSIVTANVGRIFFGTFSGTFGTEVNGTVSCVAGDTIKISCIPTKAAAGNLTLLGTAAYNTVAIERIGN
jgi:hypothetical protein